MRILVTGGAGFIGSHLCEKLLAQGHTLVCLDNLITGQESNLQPLLSQPRFKFIRQDISEPFQMDGSLEAILHFASPASPPDYLKHPIETLKVGSIGTLNALEMAKAKGSKFLLASTSEVYGDPQVHPQPESYWGHVNPIGPRSVYDEAKRFAEALTMAYHRTYGVDTRIVRIFNTYGPRMRMDDGRAIPTFITQALRGEPLTIHGDGSQTRSFCYISDLIRGLTQLLEQGPHEPVNLGNPHEMTVKELAEQIILLTESKSSLRYNSRLVDDPMKRRPDITLARERLQWEPTVPFVEGLHETIAWFSQKLKADPIRRA